MLSPKVSRDPRILRTRRMLREALVTLMEERDFEEITVQDVADRATINRATFYAHFVDIFDLLGHVIKVEFEQTLSQHLQADVPLQESVLLSMIVAVCEFLDELSRKCSAKPDCRPCEAFVEAQVKEALRERLLPGLRDAAREQADLRATLLSWSLYGVAWEWYHRQRTVGPATWARESLSVLMAPWQRAGLLTDGPVDPEVTT